MPAFPGDSHDLESPGSGLSFEPLAFLQNACLLNAEREHSRSDLALEQSRSSNNSIFRMLYYTRRNNNYVTILSTASFVIPFFKLEKVMNFEEMKRFTKFLVQWI